MSTSEKRCGERHAVNLRIKLKYKSVDSFVEKFAVNVSRGGLFIASRQVKPVGTKLRFELALADGEPAIKGEGRVIWVREYDASDPQKSHGMGVKFSRVDPRSRQILNRCLEQKAKIAAQTGQEDEEAPRFDAVESGSFAAPETVAEVAAGSEASGPAAESPPPATAAEPPPAPSQAAAPQTPPVAANDDDDTDDDTLDALLASTGLGESALAKAWEHLRTQASQDGEGDLDSLLSKEAATPVTVDEATAGLARLLGGEPVRPRAKGGAKPAGRARGDSRSDEISALMPPPGSQPQLDDLDELTAPRYIESEASGPTVNLRLSGPVPGATRPSASPIPQETRTAVQEVPTELGSRSVPHSSKERPHPTPPRHDPDTDLDAEPEGALGSSRFGRRATSSEIVAAPWTAEEAAVFENELAEPGAAAAAAAETRVESMAEGSAEGSSDDPQNPPPRKSGFFRKLFGK